MSIAGPSWDTSSLDTSLQVAPPAGDPEIDAMRPWFHNLHLPDGRQTSPHHRLGDFPRDKWERLAPHLPADLSGWRVLDVGCNAGFYSFELARRGADVMAVDVDEHYLKQGRWAAERMEVAGRVRFGHGSVWDVLREGRRYDLVLFMGLFYHLRYPLLALDGLARLAERLLVFQTLTADGSAPPAGGGQPAREGVETPEDLDFDDRERLLSPQWPSMAFIEHAFAGDATNWWVPTSACAEAMLRSAGLQVRAHFDDGAFVCTSRAAGGAAGRDASAPLEALRERAPGPTLFDDRP